MLKGQGCADANSPPAHAREPGRGWSGEVLKDQDFNNLPLTHSLAHVHARGNEVRGTVLPSKRRGESKQRTVEGSRVRQARRGWPPLLSEKMTLISQSLFRTREEAKRTKKWQRSLRIVCAAGIPETSWPDMMCLAWIYHRGLSVQVRSALTNSCVSIRRLSGRWENGVKIDSWR